MGVGLAVAFSAGLGAARPSAAHPGDDSGGGLWPGTAQLTQRGGQSLAHAAVTPPTTPRPVCGPGSRPETGMQGRVPGGESDAGFTCNTTALLSHHGRAGGYECAYYDSTLLFPSNAQFLSAERTGVTVLDMADPAKPVQTASLITPSMLSPHESLLLNEKRGLLVAVMGNPLFAPGVVDIYDLNEDCRKPALQSSLPVGLLGHESGFAPDGNTFYATSISTGQVTAVDVTNPKLPRTLAVANYKSHGLTVSDDGNRGYVAASSGLIIIDLSEVQARRPNPRIREISRLTWDTLTIPQVAPPVTIDGRPYLVEIDESAEGGVRHPTGGAPARKPRRDRWRPGGRQPGAGLRRPLLLGAPARGPRHRGVLVHRVWAEGVRHPRPRGAEGAGLLRRAGGPQCHRRPSQQLRDVEPGVRAPERGEIWYSDGNTGFYAVRVADGVWPFRAGSEAPRRCLARRSTVGRRNIGRVRLGYTRPRALRRIDPRPVRRGRFVYRWCVRRSAGLVTAVFSSRSAERVACALWRPLLGATARARWGAAWGSRDWRGAFRTPAASHPGCCGRVHTVRASSASAGARSAASRSPTGAWCTPPVRCAATCAAPAYAERAAPLA